MDCYILIGDSNDDNPFLILKGTEEECKTEKERLNKEREDHEKRFDEHLKAKHQDYPKVKDYPKIDDWNTAIRNWEIKWDAECDLIQPPTYDSDIRFFIF